MMKTPNIKIPKVPAAITKLFPRSLPKFLAPNRDEILVIHISGSSIKSAYLRRVGSRYELQDWAISYHWDILKVPDIEIVNFILTFIQKNSIRTKEVILTLIDLEGVVIKETLVRAMGESDVLGSAIKFQLAEDIKFDANLAQVGWRHLSDAKDDEGAKLSRVLALIIDRNLINRFVELIELCRLYTGVITSHKFHWEAIIKDLKGLEETSAILDVQYASSTLSVYVGKQLFFHRELPITLKKLIEVLEGKDTLDPAVPIEKLQNKLFSVPFPINLHHQESEAASHGFEGYYRLRPLLEIFGRDINLSFNYLNSHYHIDPPRQIYLTGIGGNFKSLIQFLKDKFGLETGQFPAAHLFLVAEQNSVSIQHAQNSIISLTAVALGDHSQINLLPVELQTNRFEKLQKFLLITVSAVVLTVLVLMIGRFQWRSSNNNRSLTEAYQRLQELEEIIQLNKQITEREDVRNFILSKEIPVDGLLKQISVTIPNEIVLKRVFYDAPSRELRLEGKISKDVPGRDAVISKFSAMLGESPLFTKTSVTHSQTLEETTEFQITAQMKHDK